MGRRRRRRIARSTAPRPMMGKVLAVPDTTTSNSCSRAGTSARGRVCPPTCWASARPRSALRLATVMCCGRRPAKCIAVSATISPAPTNSTRVSARRSNGGHADGVRADLGAGAHGLGYAERALEQRVQRGAQGARLFGQTHRLLHLAQDLRFAQHHRVEPGGHAKGVPGRGRAGVGIDVRGQLGCGCLAPLAQPAHGRAQQAGAQQRAFGLRPVQPLAQRGQRRTHAVGRHGKAGPQVQRGRVVAEAQRQHRHGRTPHSVGGTGRVAGERD